MKPHHEVKRREETRVVGVDDSTNQETGDASVAAQVLDESGVVVSRALERGAMVALGHQGVAGAYAGVGQADAEVVEAQRHRREAEHQLEVGDVERRQSADLGAEVEQSGLVRQVLDGRLAGLAA